MLFRGGDQGINSVCNCHINNARNKFYRYHLNAELTYQCFSSGGEAKHSAFSMYTTVLEEMCVRSGVKTDTKTILHVTENASRQQDPSPVQTHCGR